MAEQWAVQAAKEVAMYLDWEGFPMPIANIIQRCASQKLTPNQSLVLCSCCGGWFDTADMHPPGDQPDAEPVCDSCIRQQHDVQIRNAHADALKDELAAETEAHRCTMNRNVALRASLESARSIFERYRDCRKYGVGMLQGGHIALDDDVSVFLEETKG